MQQEPAPKSFKSKKALWWSVGVLALLCGFLVLSILLPTTSEPYGSSGPDVQVPAMKNVPENSQARPLELETKDE